MPASTNVRTLKNYKGDQEINDEKRIINDVTNILKTSRETIIDLTEQRDAMDILLNEFGEELDEVIKENEELKEIVKSNDDTNSMWKRVLDNLIEKTHSDASELANKRSEKNKYYDTFKKRYRKR
jgi:hypothetical protein